jgi:hypothetical protein
MGADKINLAKPGIALQRIQSEGILFGQMPKDGFGPSIDKVSDRTRVC